MKKTKIRNVVIDGGKNTNDMLEWWLDMYKKLMTNEEYKEKKVFIMTDENDKVVVLYSHKEAVMFSIKMMRVYGDVNFISSP